MKRLSQLLLGSLLTSCASSTYDKTVTSVDKDRFMGKWYVQAGRFTSFEKDPYNSTETYTWNEKEKRIDVEFRYNQGSPDGKKKDPAEGVDRKRQRCPLESAAVLAFQVRLPRDRPGG